MIFELTGIEAVLNELLKLDAKVSKKGLRQAMRAGMQPMKAALKAAVPVHTGKTRSAVRIKATKRSRTGFGVMVSIGEKDYVGKTFYAAMVEFGTSKQPPQGYMRKAFDATQAESIKTAEDFLRSFLAL